MFLIFAVLYSVLDAWHDYAFVNRKTIRVFNFNYQYWHSIDGAIKALVVFTIGWFSVHPIVQSIHDVFYLMFIYGAIRWILHDLTYNALAGHKWYYIGSGLLDKTIMHWQFYLKIIALFFAIVFIMEYWTY